MFYTICSQWSDPICVLKWKQNHTYMHARPHTCTDTQNMYNRTGCNAVQPCDANWEPKYEFWQNQNCSQQSSLLRAMGWAKYCKSWITKWIIISWLSIHRTSACWSVLTGPRSSYSLILTCPHSYAHKHKYSRKICVCPQSFKYSQKVYMSFSLSLRTFLTHSFLLHNPFLSLVFCDRGCVNLYHLLLLLRSQLCLCGSPFLVRFLGMWLFLNPTLEVITFHLHGWCVCGRVFVAVIHPSRTWMSRSFLSMRWNASVHRLELSLYSLPK